MDIREYRVTVSTWDGEVVDSWKLGIVPERTDESEELMDNFEFFFSENDLDLKSWREDIGKEILESLKVDVKEREG